MNSASRRMIGIGTPSNQSRIERVIIELLAKFHCRVRAARSFESRSYRIGAEIHDRGRISHLQLDVDRKPVSVFLIHPEVQVRPRAECGRAYELKLTEATSSREVYSVATHIDDLVLPHQQHARNALRDPKFRCVLADEWPHLCRRILLGFTGCRRKSCRSAETAGWEVSVRLRALLLIGSIATGLTLAGCDKCGNPIQIDSPTLPGSCYGRTEAR
jgi:hypothetical protein